MEDDDCVNGDAERTEPIDMAPCMEWEMDALVIPVEDMSSYHIFYMRLFNIGHVACPRIQSSISLKFIGLPIMSCCGA